MKFSTVAKATMMLSSLSLLLVVFGLLMNSGSKAEKFDQERPWLLLSNLVGVTKLVDILQENTAPNTDVDEIAHSAVGMVEGDLLVIDFNTPTLCGKGGCAIAAYRVSTGERLLFIYASQPSGQPIVKLTQRSGVELPCLLVSPSSAVISEQRTKRETLCYRNDEWTVEES